MASKGKQKLFTFGAIISIALFLLCYINIHFKIYALNTFTQCSNDKSTFSILTFNIAAYDSTKFTNTLQKGLLKLIEQEEPDIICFQEMSFESLIKIKPQMDSIYGTCEVLKGGDQMWRLRFYSQLPLRNFRKHRCAGKIDTEGMTDEEIAHIEQAQKQMNVMSAEFEVAPGYWVTMFSGHLRSSAYSAAHRSMAKDASWLERISTYKRNYDVGKCIRDYEAKNIRRLVNDVRSEGMPVIVVGDLNDWCGSECIDTLLGNDLRDAWWEGGNGFGWTYSGWHLKLRLDHILYSDELELVDVRVIDTDLSDHKPLMATFSVR